MSATIVKLKSTRRSTRRSKGNNIIFPQIYRVTGFFYDLHEGVEGAIIKDDDLSPSDRPAPPCYTLDSEKTVSLADVACTPIESLDPTIDKGWLIVRHHTTVERADAYLDAVLDLMTDWDETEWCTSIYTTELGIFSLTSRPATETCPDHLIIYQYKVPDTFMGGLIDETLIYDSTGKLIDPDSLMPPDVAEDYGEVADMINAELQK